MINWANLIVLVVTMVVANLIYLKWQHKKLLAEARQALLKEFTDLIDNNEEITMTIIKNKRPE